MWSNPSLAPSDLICQFTILFFSFSIIHHKTHDGTLILHPIPSHRKKKVLCDGSDGKKDLGEFHKVSSRPRDQHAYIWVVTDSMRSSSLNIAKVNRDATVDINKEEYRHWSDSKRS